MSNSEKSFSVIFEEKVEEVACVLNEFPWQNREAYCMWLTQTYYLVRHTTRLLCLAAAKTPIENREMHYEWLTHLKEEKNHDLPILKDLKALGRTIEGAVEFEETQLLINNQYHWLSVGTDVSLLGYALMLEGLSVKCIPSMLKSLEAAELENASSFIKLHGHIVEGHYPAGLDLLTKITSPKIQNEIMDNLKQTSLIYSKIYRRISESAQIKVSNNSRAA